MSLERIHSVHRSPVSFFDSSWEVGSWDDFGHTLRSMERRMKEMDRQFEQMFTQFMRLTPTTETHRSERQSIRDRGHSRDSFHESRFGSDFFSDDLDALPSSPMASSSLSPATTKASSKRSKLGRQDSWDFGFPDADVKDPVVTDKEGNRVLRLQYDVRQFKPEEIIVKTLDNKLEVVAKHESGDDDHKVYREYHRTCVLPDGVEPEILSSTFSPEGILSIEAPMPKEKVEAIEEPPPPRDQPISIPIQHQKSIPANGDKDSK